MLKQITDKNFDQEVLNSEVPVIVDFWAEWCGPCRMIAPVLEEIQTDLGSKVKIVKLDIQENTEVPTKYGVRSIPTLMMFSGGKHLSTKVGALPKDSLLEWINSELD